jgi:hypothetical protein
MTFIGVDVGANGGIAAITDQRVVIGATNMPKTDKDMLDTVLAYSDPGSFAVLEQVASSPMMGVASAFSFGRSYGLCRMALTAAKVSFSEVSPLKWQRTMHCLSGGDKNVTKMRAQQLFPYVKVTHAIADALLLAEYCRLICDPQAKAV